MRQDRNNSSLFMWRKEGGMKSALKNTRKNEKKEKQREKMQKGTKWLALCSSEIKKKKSTNKENLKKGEIYIEMRTKRAAISSDGRKERDQKAQTFNKGDIRGSGNESHVAGPAKPTSSLWAVALWKQPDYTCSWCWPRPRSRSKLDTLFLSGVPRTIAKPSRACNTAQSKIGIRTNGSILFCWAIELMLLLLTNSPFFNQPSKTIKSICQM